MPTINAQRIDTTEGCYKLPCFVRSRTGSCSDRGDSIYRAAACLRKRRRGRADLQFGIPRGAEGGRVWGTAEQRRCNPSGGWSPKLFDNSET